MIRIFSSATRLVLIVMVLAYVGLAFKGIIDPKDFGASLGVILAFYFGKGQNNPTQ